MNIIAIVAAGVFYFLGAALMWMICDEDDEGDVERRPLFSLFWPFVVAFSLLNRALGREE